MRVCVCGWMCVCLKRERERGAVRGRDFFGGVSFCLWAGKKEEIVFSLVHCTRLVFRLISSKLIPFTSDLVCIELQIRVHWRDVESLYEVDSLWYSENEVIWRNGIEWNVFNMLLGRVGLEDDNNRSSRRASLYVAGLRQQEVFSRKLFSVPWWREPNVKKGWKWQTGLDMTVKALNMPTCRYHVCKCILSDPNLSTSVAQVHKESLTFGIFTNEPTE